MDLFLTFGSLTFIPTSGICLRTTSKCIYHKMTIIQTVRRFRLNVICILAVKSQDPKYAQAIDEMMARIKSGTALRPTQKRRVG